MWECLPNLAPFRLAPRRFSASCSPPSTQNAWLPTSVLLEHVPPQLSALPAPRLLLAHCTPVSPWTRSPLGEVANPGSAHLHPEGGVASVPTAQPPAARTGNHLPRFSLGLQRPPRLTKSRSEVPGNRPPSSPQPVSVGSWRKHAPSSGGLDSTAASVSPLGLGSSRPPW